MLDLTGQKFGRLTVLRRDSKKYSNGNVHWVCKCICGNEKVVDGYALRKKITRSCGCLRTEISGRTAKQNGKFKQNIGNYKNLVSKSGILKSSLLKGKKNSSGVIGVSFDKSQQKWLARLMFHGEFVLLKSFDAFEDAVSARQKAENKYFKENVAKK